MTRNIPLAPHVNERQSDDEGQWLLLHIFCTLLLLLWAIPARLSGHKLEGSRAAENLPSAPQPQFVRNLHRIGVGPEAQGGAGGQFSWSGRIADGFFRS